MYETAEEVLARAGFVHYEISNWARGEEHCCRHNLGYWRNEAYLGLGAGAHSWRHGRRWANIASPARYTAALLAGERPLSSEEIINAELEMGETMMMGLRLLEEGVAYDRFQARSAAAFPGGAAAGQPGVPALPARPGRVERVANPPHDSDSQKSPCPQDTRDETQRRLPRRQAWEPGLLLSEEEP